MTHIAYITAEYPHPDTPAAGGIGSFVKLMATSLVRNNYKVTIFLCLSLRDKIWYDNEVRIVEIKGVAPSRFSPLTNRYRINKTVSKHIKNNHIDLIEAADWEGLHALCNFKIPVITRIHGSVTYFNYLQGINKPRLLYYLEKRALSKSSKVIAVSEFSGKITQKVFGYKMFDFEVIYNGIDTDLFCATTTETSSNQDICYFGTLVRKKGILSLAHIFNEVHKTNPEASLLLIGKDSIDFIENRSTWELMQAILTPEARARVHYKGLVPYEQMSQAITSATVCVFPSYAEAFPISWLEAMSMEKAIVASSIGWARESIEDKVSGLLENPDNYKAFAKKINKLLKDPSLSRALGSNAKQRVVDRFDQRKLIVQNMDVYKKLLDDQ